MPRPEATAPTTQLIAPIPGDDPAAHLVATMPAASPTTHLVQPIHDADAVRQKSAAAPSAPSEPPAAHQAQPVTLATV